MSEREEGYRAGKEARSGFVQRATRGSHASGDAVTRMVNAAVYRYEHEKRNGIDEAESAEPAEGEQGEVRG